MIYDVDDGDDREEDDDPLMMMRMHIVNLYNDEDAYCLPV